MKKSAKFIPFVIFTIGILGFAIFFIIFSSLSDYTRPVSTGYTILNYDVSVNVNEDNSYDITETITADFLVRKHGIYRYLPIYQTIECEENGQVYKRNYKLSYTNINCSYLVDDYIEGGYYILQIGSEANTYIGEKTYTISYKLEIGDDKIAEFDQFYYNLIGEGWDTTISDISFTVNFDKPITQTTSYLYIMNNPEIEINIVNNSFSYSYSGILDPFSGITARVTLDEGYFNTTTPSVLPDVLLLVSGIALLVIISLWVIKKNNNQPIIPVVEFTAPKGISPADAGYIIDRIVNKKDIASLIVYWAQKGFLKIVEKDKDCQLIKLKDMDGVFKIYELDIFNALFNKSNIINLNDTDEDLAIAINKAKKAIQYENKEKNFSNSRTTMRIVFVGLLSILCFGIFAYLGDKLALTSLSLMMSGIFALVILLGLGFIVEAKELKYSMSHIIYLLLSLFGYILIAGMFVYVAIISFDISYNPIMISIFVPLIIGVAIYFLLKINVRTEEGNKLLGQLIGLKQFILVTEKDRIKMLVKDDPSLFYEVLPYAYVLGVSDIWIKKFEDLIIDLPDWYEGQNNGNLFFGYYLLSTMNRANSFYSRSIAQFNANKASSSGRGFGGRGGGFGGGGFGGGGGGSW